MNTFQTKLSEKRFSVIIGKETQESLKLTAKTYRITQSEVIMTMHENMDLSVLAPKFAAVRTTKLASRGGKAKIIDKLRKLTPEQLEAILASIPQSETIN